MGNCSSIDHIADDHIHTDIPCNIEEPQQKYCLGTVSKRNVSNKRFKHVSADIVVYLIKVFATATLFQFTFIVKYCAFTSKFGAYSVSSITYKQKKIQPLFRPYGYQNLRSNQFSYGCMVVSSVSNGHNFIRSVVEVGWGW